MKTIKLMADYQCHPLWDVSPDNYGDIDPEILPISRTLKGELTKWARTYDATLNMADPAKSGFENKKAEANFKHQGQLLASRLQEELGTDFRIEIKI
jgi:hypothetical protein